MLTPTTFNLIVQPQEADAIIIALRKAFPMEVVEDFVNNLRMQINSQVTAVNQPPAPPIEPEVAPSEPEATPSEPTPTEPESVIETTPAE